jgi:hypothetical protein
MNADAWLAIALAQVVASGAMAGLIWFVQVVHYPLFDGVQESAFVRYAERHRARTTFVVAPLMSFELASAVLLLPLFGAPADPLLAWIGVALVGVVWGMTFFVAVPLHARLDRGFDARAHRALVATNWIRTIAWSARFGVAMAMLVGVSRSLGS